MIESLGLSDSDLADMAYDIEEAIEAIINEKIEENEWFKQNTAGTEIDI